MGYELVEGRVESAGWRYGQSPDTPYVEQIVERRRVSFAPQASWREGRYWPFN